MAIASLSLNEAAAFHAKRHSWRQPTAIVAFVQDCRLPRWDAARSRGFAWGGSEKRTGPPLLEKGPQTRLFFVPAYEDAEICRPKLGPFGAEAATKSAALHGKQHRAGQ
jgi:hypothetical protein